MPAERVVLWVMVQSPWLAGILGHVGAHQPETVGRLACGVGGQGKPLTNHLTASSPIVCVNSHPTPAGPEQGGGDLLKGLVFASEAPV